MRYALAAPAALLAFLLTNTYAAEPRCRLVEMTAFNGQPLLAERCVGAFGIKVGMDRILTPAEVRELGGN